MDDKPIPEVIEGLRALLRAINEGRMTCSSAYRNQLQGAVVALEALAGGSTEAAGWTASAKATNTPPAPGRVTPPQSGR